MLDGLSIEDWSNFFYLLQNCVLEGYDILLYHNLNLFIRDEKKTDSALRDSSILRTSSFDKFLSNILLICSSCFKKFGFCYIFEGCFSYFDILMWTEILVTRYKISYLCLDF